MAIGLGGTGIADNIVNTMSPASFITGVYKFGAYNFILTNCKKITNFIVSKKNFVQRCAEFFSTRQRRLNPFSGKASFLFFGKYLIL